ncbi:hypothetical protein M8C21_010676, partial [Ambrosia artemisiifolia]
MADDDDDSFGEFTFAPIHHPTVHSSHIPITTTNNDVVWADFTFHQNNQTHHTVNLPSPSPSPSQPKWEKIQGALPLSFFGDEEESVTDDVKVEPSNVSGTTSIGSDNNNNGYKSNGQLGINDLIADLYGPRQLQQQQPHQTVNNGNELDFSALTSTVSNDPVSKSNSFGLDTVLAGDGDKESDDEGGWEFVDAVARNDKDHKENSEKIVSTPGLQGGSHGPIDLFAASNNGFFVQSHLTNSGLDSKPITNFQNDFSADLKVDSKGTTNELSSNPLGGGDDFDDTFGEFETAFVEHSSVKK